MHACDTAAIEAGTESGRNEASMAMLSFKRATSAPSKSRRNRISLMQSPFQFDAAISP
jgi:hypothetical protein